MLRRLLLPIAIVPSVVAAATFAFLPAGAAADNPTLKGSVGPGFVITLKDANGAAVKHLDTGTYTIHVDDLGTEHNFHLSGPGVNEVTSVDDTGTVTWTVTFMDGTYTFVCDAHASTMKGSFTVGMAGSNPPPPPPPASGGFAKGTALKGTVGPGYTISVKDGAGKPVKKIHTGTTYTVSITDKSGSHDFHLFGPGVNKKTAVGSKASAKWRLKFRAGTYRFQCDPHRTVMKGSFKAS